MAIRVFDLDTWISRHGAVCKQFRQQSDISIFSLTEIYPDSSRRKRQNQSRDPNWKDFPLFKDSGTTPPVCDALFIAVAHCLVDIAAH